MDNKKEPLNCKLFGSINCPQDDSKIFSNIRSYDRIPSGPPGRNWQNSQYYIEAQKICSECPKFAK